MKTFEEAAALLEDCSGDEAVAEIFGRYKDLLADVGTSQVFKGYCQMGIRQVRADADMDRGIAGAFFYIFFTGLVIGMEMEKP